MKLLFLGLLLLVLPVISAAEEPRGLKLSQVDYRRRIGVRVGLRGVARLRVRSYIEYRYKVKEPERSSSTTIR
jgi:hypothetical protein